jgi:hypothetical protein
MVRVVWLTLAALAIAMAGGALAYAGTLAAGGPV